MGYEGNVADRRTESDLDKLVEDARLLRRLLCELNAAPSLDSQSITRLQAAKRISELVEDAVAAFDGPGVLK